MWNRHYNLGKFDALSAWFKKEESVSTITEVFEIVTDCIYELARKGSFDPPEWKVKHVW